MSSLPSLRDKFDHTTVFSGDRQITARAFAFCMRPFAASACMLIEFAAVRPGMTVNGRSGISMKSPGGVPTRSKALIVGRGWC